MISKYFLSATFTILIIKCIHGKPDPDQKAADGGSGTVPDASIPANTYPNPRRDEKIQDTYGAGTKVADPYRWMEDPKSAETKAFIKAEMDITTPYLEKSPFRNELTARYKELYDHPKFIGFFQHGKKFFSFQNTGLQKQDVLYIHDSFNDNGKVFIDPNAPNEDGTTVLDVVSFSDDGLNVAYSASNSTEARIVRFKNVENGSMYKDKLVNVRDSETLPWTHDNKGIFYSAYSKDPKDTSTKHHKLFFHALGTDQSNDPVVAEFPDQPDYYISGLVSDCGKYLIVTGTKDYDSYVVYIADLEKIKYEIKTKLELKPIVSKLEADYTYIANDKETFIFLTDKDADNGKLVSIDISKPDAGSKDLVPENKKDKLEFARAAYDKYVLLCYTRDVKSVLQLHDITTGKMIQNFPLEIGTVDDEEGLFVNRKSPNVFVNFESFLTPGTVYHCDLTKPPFNLQMLREVKVKNFCKDNFKVDQVFFNSKDGTKIPMYIVYKKDLPKCGNNLAYLTAFGTFGNSRLPYFAVNRLVIICNLNGIHAVANVRGGGEYGKQWHQAGQREKKQNSFDDFQAAAEYLINNKFTNSKVLVSNAANSGGLIPAASMNQRPDLFGVVIIESGVFDMLRYDQFAGRKYAIPEFGTATNPKDFEFLYKYSPLHNIKLSEKQQYPAVMVSTGELNDQIEPFHTLKFIATLQYQAKSQPNQKNPFIMKIDSDGGAEYEESRDKEMQRLVEEMCFILRNTGIKFQSSQPSV